MSSAKSPPSSVAGRRPSPLQRPPGSFSRPPLRSRPSALSFASLAPSDSRSNPRSTAGRPASPTLSEATTRRPALSPLSGGGRKRSGSNGTVRSTSSRLGMLSGSNSPPASTALVSGRKPDEVDLLRISDPDLLFRTFTVREVRYLERKALDGAKEKQEELRQMVGERYRDLLGAADSIVRMKLGCEGVVDKLERVREACGKEALLKRAAGSAMENDDHASDPVAGSTGTSYALAWLVKLLLDLPSYIHTSLEDRRFLPAARLSSLGRIVYRELASGSWDPSGETKEGEVLEAFPVVERQWDVVSQLGPQIVRRAKAHLRKADVAEGDTSSGGGREKLVETLAAVVLLENISVPEVLDLLLFARKSTLDALVGAAGGKSGAREDAEDREGRTELLSASVKTVLSTLDQASELFATTPQTASTNSASLVSLLLALQRPHSATLVATGRSSRSMSISLPLPGMVNGTHPLTGCSHSMEHILSSLPNANQVIRYLPPSILAFTPFIDVNSSRNDFPAAGVQGVLKEWYRSAEASLVKLLEEVLDEITSVHGLLSLRRSLQGALRPSVPVSVWRTELAERVECALEGKFSSLHRLKLAALSSSALSATSDWLAKPDTRSPPQPLEFLFDQALPSLVPRSAAKGRGRESKAGGNGELDAFKGYTAAARAKAEGRYEPASAVVRGMEKAAKGLRADLESWLAKSGAGGGNVPHPVERKDKGKEEYVSLAQEVCDQLISGLDDSLVDTRGENLCVNQQLFVGSVALAARASSTFARDLALGTDNTELLESLATGLERVAGASLRGWRNEVVNQAATHFCGSRSPSSTNPSRSRNSPSRSAYKALEHLSASLSILGPHRIQADPSIRATLIAEFFGKIVGPGSNFDDAALRWDLALFREIAKAADSSVSPPASTEVDPGDSKTALEYLQRTQTLFAPLIAGPRPTVSGGTGGGVLLPLGPPPAIEFRNPVEMAKPGPRFVLLPITT